MNDLNIKRMLFPLLDCALLQGLALGWARIVRVAHAPLLVALRGVVYRSRLNLFAALLGLRGHRHRVVSLEGREGRLGLNLVA